MKNTVLAGAALALMGVEEPWEASVPIARPSLLGRARAIGRKLGVNLQENGCWYGSRRIPSGSDVCVARDRGLV
jgi:hypothetical protein